MDGFNELARLLAVPSIVSPPSRENEEEDEDRKLREREPDGKPGSRDVDEFEHIEVGDPRDGP